MIDRATVDRIYAAADIVDVINDFVPLRRKGANYQACCPFHTEKTPSFVVSPSKGVFKCFGCGKGGNAVTFVMEHENITYVEALKYVARKYGIEVQERELSDEEVHRNDDRESMMVLNGWAADYFKESLGKTPEGRNIALTYFHERGFTDATIEKFGLGYCPKGGDTFSKAALKAGYKEEFLVGTGLSFKRDNGTLYDQFSERVMFPIHTVSGRVLAFGGRTMRTDKTVAKYKNSPESEIYSKKMTLYGLFFAKRAISQLKNAILVEGYTDVISMHQSGVENVVASSGTSLTTEQVKLLKRFTDNVTVMYDGDSAGIKASLRGIDMILREGLNVRIVLLPPEHDPDSFAKSHTSQQVQDYVLEHEEDFITFKSKLLMRDSKGDIAKRSEVVKDVVESISVIPDAITRSMYSKECAKIMDVDEGLLASEIAKIRLNVQSDEQTREFFRNQQRQNDSARDQRIIAESSSSGVAVGSSIEELEKEMMCYLLRYGHLDFDFTEGRTTTSINVAETIIGELSSNAIELQNPTYRIIYECYTEQYALLGKGVQVPLDIFINHSNPEVCNTAVDLLTIDDNYTPSKLWAANDASVESEQERLSTAVPRCVILYKSKIIEGITAKLQSELGNVNLDDEQASSITRKIAALNKQRATISKRLKRLIL